MPPRRPGLYWAKLTDKDIAEDVARLRDHEKFTWKRIEEWLGTVKNLIFKGAMIRRAYDFAHPGRVRDAVEKGQQTNRGPYSFLGETRHREIRDLLKGGIAVVEIAEHAGCCKNTVRRELEKLKSRS